MCFVEMFDIRTAFLSGKEIERELYVRAPKEGLPSAEGWPAVRPGELLQALKSALASQRHLGSGT